MLFLTNKKKWIHVYLSRTFLPHSGQALGIYGLCITLSFQVLKAKRNTNNRWHLLLDSAVKLLACNTRCGTLLMNLTQTAWFQLLVAWIGCWWVGAEVGMTVGGHDWFSASHRTMAHIHFIDLAPIFEIKWPILLVELTACLLILKLSYGLWKTWTPSVTGLSETLNIWSLLRYTSACCSCTGARSVITLSLRIVLDE